MVLIKVGKASVGLYARVASLATMMHCAQLTLQDGRPQLGRGRGFRVRLRLSPPREIRKYILRKSFEIGTDLICRKKAPRRDLHLHLEMTLDLM